MRGSKKDLKKTIETDKIAIREAEWGDIHVDFESYQEDFDVGPLLKGLPDDRCQCPHWGYVLKGSMRVNYKDREETMNGGDAYLLEPGHIVKVDAGTELVEFSPMDEFRKTMEVIERNFASIQAAAP